MPGTALTNLTLVEGWSDGEDGWGSPMNANLRELDALVMPFARNVGLNSPPDTGNGFVYVVGTSPSGPWTGQPNSIARYAAGSINAWEFFTPKNGWEIYNTNNGRKYRFSGSEWIDTTPGSESGIVRVRNIGDATYTPVLTDAGKVLRMSNSSATVFTIPSSSDVSFPNEIVITLRQVGAGQVTIAPASGVTLNIPTGFQAKTARQFSTLMIHQVSINTWDLMGDMAS